VISLLVDGSLFASLVFSNFYLWLGTETWPPAGLGMSTLAVAAAALALLVACAGATHLAVRALRHDNRPAATLCWLAAAACGIACILSHGWSLLLSGRSLVHAYASVSWTLAAYHAVHVLI